MLFKFGSLPCGEQVRGSHVPRGPSTSTCVVWSEFGLEYVPPTSQPARWSWYWAHREPHAARLICRPWPQMRRCFQSNASVLHAARPPAFLVVASVPIGFCDIFDRLHRQPTISAKRQIAHVRMINPDAMTNLFRRPRATRRRSSMPCARRRHGRQRRPRVHALPLDRLQEVMRRYRPPDRDSLSPLAGEGPAWAKPSALVLGEVDDLHAAVGGGERVASGS